MAKSSIRLGNFVIPERYKILLKPDLKNFTFEGEETITLRLEKPTKSITLHSLELEILFAQALLKTTDSTDSTDSTVTYDKNTETATLTFPKTLPKGQVDLNLIFKGLLNDKLAGFYRSRYEVNGQGKFLATTQFESTDARRAFPSFDEPDKKAIFEVSLIIPPGTTAISNTIESVVKEHESGWQLLEFVPTPKMSTYLLAFIVGDFEYISKKTDSGVLVRVFVTKGKKSQASFALDVAAKVLEFYEKYFDIPYPLPTMDLIAIPDFAAGAMENWGAITYRETALLVDEKLTATANRQWVALVIAHELAHQWFGNLVTMEWWTHLWLNEGFASYIEYVAIDSLYPEWDLWTQFISSEHGDALREDALETTHPIEIEVYHPSEISEIFDAVSYSKGSSIIRMLAQFLGPKVFRDGLRHYLKKHSYVNAKTEDLWKAFEQVSKKPVKKIMSNWTSKPGHPLITISETKKSLKLSQSRFYSSEKAAKKSKDKTLWQIPLIVEKGTKGKNAVINKFLMDKKTLSLPKPKEGEWVNLNYHESSFLRVDYPEKYLKSLKKAIENNQLDTLDRLGLVRDVFDLAQAGKIKTAEALDLLQSFKNEEDYSVWVAILSGLGAVKNLISEEKYYEEFKKYSRQILKNITAKIGWDKKPGEKHTDTLLRSMVLSSFGGFGDPETIKKAQELFKKYYDKKIDLEPDLRGVIYRLVAENGDLKEYSMLLNLYDQADLQEEKNRIAANLGRFKQKYLIEKTLKFALSKKVRTQDTFRIINFVWSHSLGKSLAWDFTKKNWPELLKRYSGGGHFLPRFIKPAENFTSQENLLDFQNFFKKNRAPGAERTILQVVEQIESNINWLKRDSEGIEKILLSTNY